MAEIQHPLLHQHPLKLVPIDDDGQKRACAVCDDELSGEVYACDSCRLYLHQSCANLPEKIEHFIHPGCPLFLKPVPKSPGGGGELRGMMLWYRCEACNFEIGVSLGQKLLQPNNIEEDELLRRLSHDHPLELHTVEKVRGGSSEEDAELKKYCRVCDKLISGSYYACNSSYCGYCIHKSCAGHLPSQIRHFYHPCTLSLVPDDGRYCSACGEYRDVVFLYHCEKCNFRMHVKCAKFQHEDEGKGVQHCSHHHPLKCSEDVKEVLECCICYRKISDKSDYVACEPCQFHIHKSCMSLTMEIQHRCHPHPLWLKYIRYYIFCSTCLHFTGPFWYQSEKCKFFMCVKCALFSQEVSVKAEEHIIHFCHQHPLQLFKDPKKDKTDIFHKRNLECLVCSSPASGLTYGCKDCDVYLHKSCLDILPQIIHTEADVSLFLTRRGHFDPKTRIGGHVRCQQCLLNITSLFQFKRMDYDNDEDSWCIPCALEEVLSIRVTSPSSVFSQLHFHPCSFTLKLFPTFTCNVCSTQCHTHAYYCDQCDFYVGSKCAQMSMKVSDGGGEGRIRHFCHGHPLQPSQEDTEVSTASCKICGGLCMQQPFYFCSDCDFHIHKSCLEILPQKIEKHYFNCSLVLLTTSSYRCIACQKENSSGLTFRAIQRGFDICVKCVIWPENKQNDDGTFTSIHHWHQLALIVDIIEKDANCLLCRSKISTSAYYCSECKDYFHKACAQLPLVMQHPLHKRHPLTLTSSHLLPEASKNCSLCQGDLILNDSHNSSVYYCKECGFQLDKKCATSFPSIQYQGHPHLLTVVENMQGREVCNVCSVSCINKMVFRCARAECNFSLHLSCGPLPCKIKHSCHVHPLILEDFYVEENYTDLFPCHVCEERRDPRLPVYLCAEGCPMICEITCVISEVMPKLLGAHGEVELRTTFPNVVSKVITKDEGLIDSTYDSSTVSSDGNSVVTLPTSMLEFYLYRRRILSNYSYGSWEEIMGLSHGIELEREDEDLFTFTKVAFGHFSSKLDYTQLTLLGREGIPEFISQHNGPPAGQECRLPKTLMPIYEEYFGKYRPISETSSPFSTCWDDESFFEFVFCAVLHNMRTTKLVDVTNERVLQWLTLLKLVELGRANIDLSFDKMKRVWEAHFLIKAKAIVDDKSARLDRMQKELSTREEELLRELEDVRKKKEEIKKQEEVHHKYAGDGMRSLRKEYADALLIKWKPASDVYFDCKYSRRDAIEPRRPLRF